MRKIVKIVMNSVIKNMKDIKIINQVSLFSIVIIVFALLLFLVIVFYINPFLVNSYESLDIDIPARIVRFVQYDGMEMLLFCIIFCALVIIKDNAFNKIISFYINIFLLMCELCIFIYYPVFIDIIHVPS